MQSGDQRTETGPLNYGVEEDGTTSSPHDTQDSQQLPDNTAQSDPVITWEASEYIHHHKNSSWYFGFAGAMLLLATVIYLLVREIFSVIVIVIMGIAVAVYAGRKPNTVRYALSQSTISIGEKRYSLEEFSSFAIMQEGGIYSVTLMPTKRFMPPVSIYFAPDDGDQIVGVLSSVLPHEERQPDLIDRLMRNIRF